MQYLTDYTETNKFNVSSMRISCEFCGHVAISISNQIDELEEVKCLRCNKCSNDLELVKETLNLII